MARLVLKPGGVNLVPSICQGYLRTRLILGGRRPKCRSGACHVQCRQLCMMRKVSLFSDLLIVCIQDFRHPNISYSPRAPLTRTGCSPWAPSHDYRMFSPGPRNRNKGGCHQPSRRGWKTTMMIFFSVLPRRWFGEKVQIVRRQSAAV